MVALYKTLLGLLHNVTVTSITFNKVRSKQDLLLKHNLLNCSNLDFENPAEVGLVPQLKLLFFTLLPNLRYLLNIQTLWNF